MFEGIFTVLYEAMTGAVWIALVASFAWGVLSILLSPCHLSSIPLIVGFVSSQGKISLGRTFYISLIFSVGIFIIVGLYLLDIIKLDWNRGLKQTKAKGLFAALILGLLFGLALGPCTFAYMAPVLGIVFQTAQTNYFFAIIFLLAFEIGHCSVIVSAGTLTGKVQKYLNWSEESKTILWIKRICGILVILGGLYLIYSNIH